MRIGLESRLKEFLTGNHTAVQKHVLCVND